MSNSHSDYIASCIHIFHATDYRTKPFSFSFKLNTIFTHLKYNLLQIGHVLYSITILSWRSSVLCRFSNSSKRSRSSHWQFDWYAVLLHIKSFRRSIMKQLICIAIFFPPSAITNGFLNCPVSGFLWNESNDIIAQNKCCQAEIWLAVLFGSFQCGC